MPKLLFALCLLVLLSTSPVVAQDKPAPPKPTPEVQKLIDEGIALIKNYDWKALMQAFEKARDTAQKTKDVAGEALALHYIGSIYGNTNQVPKALEFHQHALALFKQIGDKNREASVLSNIGGLYGNIGQLQKALEFGQHALTLYKETGNKEGEAFALNNVGRGYFRLGQSQQALECYQQALPLYKQFGNQNGEGETLTNMGDVYERKGQQRKALDFYQQAIPLYKQTGNKHGEADTLNNLGLVTFSIGEPQKALEFYRQALPLYKQMGNTFGEANTINNIGIVYARMGQSQKALDFYQQALLRFKQVGIKHGEAVALHSIGNIYNIMGHPQKALEYLQQALLRFKQTGDKNEQAETLGNLGIIYSTMRQSQKALDFFQQALRLHKQTGNEEGQANALDNLGLVYFDIGQPQRALKFYQQALPLYKQVGNKEREANILSDFGAVYFHLGQYRHAEKSLQSSIALLEQVRGAIGGSAENRQSYLASFLSTYATLVLVQTQLKESDRAFATLNKMKGRSLLDQTRRTRLLLTTLPAEERAKLRNLWRAVDKRSLSLVAAERRSRKVRAEAQEQLTNAERALQVEQDTLFARHPETTQQEAKTVTLAEVPKFLPADTALLEYAALKEDAGRKQTDKHLLFVVTVEQGKPVVSVHKVGIKQAKLAGLAEQFRQACAKAGHDYKPLAKRLAAVLLPTDVRKRLAGKKRLVICPDGAVWSVPFAALVLPDGKHLLEAFEVDSAYSATGAQAALAVPQGKAEGMLVIANPDFGDTSRFGDTVPPQIAEGVERPLSDPARPISDPARFASILERGKIKSLPGTQREADALANLYPDATLLTGKDAQETTLTQELPKYRYLHFATHGLFSDVSPLQSAIVLAAPPKGSEEDGFLTAREIMELKLNAEMVVLSACETARGKNTEGEGVVGLTWALFAAGVPTQIVSQWKVSDASTPELMTAFYGNLKAGQGKGKALRNAALAMMHDGKHAHPYHWASFVLFGDWK